MKLLISICLSVCLLTGTAFALDDPETVPKEGATEIVQPEAATPKVEGPVPTWVDKEVAKPEVGVEPGSNEDLLIQLKEVKKAYEDLRGAQGGKMLLIFLMLAAIGNALISGIKRVIIWKKEELSNRLKKWLPRIALILGVVVGFATYYGSGEGLLAAFLYGAGPATAVLVQELFGPVKSSPKKKSAG